MNSRRQSVAAWLLLVACAAVAQTVQDVPVLRERVTDLADALPPAEQSSLEARLEKLERETGSQLAVLLVDTTAPETIEQYAVRVAEAWRLGRDGIDDGVLLLIAMHDRQLRIEVGYGLEGALTDARSNRIIDAVIVPRLADGDVEGALQAGVDSIAASIRGEQLPSGAQAKSGSHSDLDFGSLLPTVLLLAIVVGGPLKKFLGLLPGALATGGIAGFVAWLMVGVLGAAVGAGIVAFLFSIFSTRGSGAWSSGGGFRGGFGGGTFGSGGSGGGFRGGGGSFGGGGASGRW